MSEVETVEEDVVEVDEAREAMLSELSDELGAVIIESFVEPNDDVWIRVSTDAWVTSAEVLKNQLGFGFFNFLSVIDWLPSPFGRDMDSQVDLAMAAEQGEIADAPDTTIETGYAGGDTRFQVFARVNDVSSQRAVTIKADIPNDTLAFPTWIPVYPGANWHEREAMEMYGVDVTGHPNPRKLYLPGSFEGHPMRKDFALLSRRIKPWPGIVDVEPMPGDDDEGGDS